MDFNKIEGLLNKLNAHRPLTSGEVERLRNEFLIDFTYNSNAIEGNTLTLGETALIINEGITIAKKPLREHLEVISHKEAYFYVESLVKAKNPLSESVIKDIHSIILMDKAQDKGKYRNVPVRIMGATQVPPQPYLVPMQMEQLLADYQSMKKNLHPIEYVSLFHLRFESIHPFIDGNGRTGRLLLNLELMKEGYPAINIKFADQQRYYQCFAEYDESGSGESMTTLVAGYLEETLKEYIRIVEYNADKGCDEDQER